MRITSARAEADPLGLRFVPCGWCRRGTVRRAEITYCWRSVCACCCAARIATARASRLASKHASAAQNGNALPKPAPASAPTPTPTPPLARPPMRMLLPAATPEAARLHAAAVAS